MTMPSEQSSVQPVQDTTPSMDTVGRNYQPQDRMHVFWLAEPHAPRLLGHLDLNQRLKGASFQYAAPWLQTGLSLSPDLPLQAGEYLPQPEHLPGALDDARPDRWGERVIRHVVAPARLSILEYAYFAGGDRFGALGISLREDEYVPCTDEAAPQLSDVHTIFELVKAVEAGQPVPLHLQRLIRPGASLGGAKPKALLQINGEDHICKFPERDEDLDMGLIEHASLTLAAKCHLQPAQTQVVQLGSQGHAIAVKRFDRIRHGSQALPQRLHAVSMKTALNAVGSEFGYPNLALFLRRYAPAQQAQDMARTLFRRMVFNILMDNTDDHEKNHALLFDENAQPHLAPAYDVLPACQSLGYQQITVGKAGAESSLENAMSEHPSFRLSSQQARDDIREVAQVVGGWQAHFQALGVTQRDIERLKASIDRPYLREQRIAAMHSR